MSMITGAIDDSDEADEVSFKPAHFPIELGLPPGDDAFLNDAKTAVRQEFRDCSKWKRLRCRKVSIFAERDRGTVYVVDVGSAVEFDWTWEGAVAFRPKSLDDSPDNKRTDFDYENASYEEDSIWSGEIVEVDERNGSLFISLNDSECRPTTGSFFVRPFEFLSVLDSVYHDPSFELIHEELKKRLAAAAGGIHPPVACSSNVGLPRLTEWWNHSWNVLWGPPGTGKTYTTGQQIAGVLADKSERILVVSTTNKATDEVALSIGEAAKGKCPKELDGGELLRIGKGASYQRFVNADLGAMLQGTESEVLSKIDGLSQQLKLFEAWEDKAMTRKQIGELRTNGQDQSKRIFVDPGVRVVVATSFKAMSNLNDDIIRKMLENSEAPFTTIFIDEAGLMSRAAIAALSLLASRRVVLVGDSKQLAPISRISRILPTRQETWLANSGVSHLNDIETTPAAVHVLSEQRRMHPDVCNVVSGYQYRGVLTTAPEVVNRESKLPSFLADLRAVWYVLDEEDTDLSSIRAERGPGNRSWIRPITPSLLEKLFTEPSMRQSSGLFITPYKAQAQAISKWFSAAGLINWESSTVHSQQGSQAEVVIFDTVNAGSCNWPFDEWKRLINVALSRAREAVIVLASRNEMEEPYLRPLVSSLSPRVLIRDGKTVRWGKADGTRKAFRRRPKDGESETDPKKNQESDYSMGGQIAKRKEMRPVLSQEQQRLSNLELDGKPRLVRGVAGSGKSVVLSNWLAKTVRRLDGEKETRIWAVYANRSLHKLLSQSIESAWQANNDDAFPWERVSLLHVKDVLTGLLPSASLSLDSFDFNYDKAAEEFLNRQDVTTLLPRCNALFIDEAQDMGPFTLKLLLLLVEKTDEADENSRSAHIFYDNAQNIYDRGTPKWSEFGLDMRGRSSIMKESFRSTNPITELAVNVLHRLSPLDESQDHRELLSRGLMEVTKRDGQEWLRVRFNQVNGPKPIFRKSLNADAEMEMIGTHLTYLITEDRVSPEDIVLIYNGSSVADLLLAKLSPKMAAIGVELSVQTNRAFERHPNTLIISTPHSYKGYDAEVVIIPCADRYVTSDGQILATNLYVAMTRARSLLAVYSQEFASGPIKRLNDAFESCLAILNSPPPVESATSTQDDFNDILEQIGQQHRKWLLAIWKAYEVIQEPIMGGDGKLIAEPLFWFKSGSRTFACFGADPMEQDVKTGSKDHGIRVLVAGDEIPSEYLQLPFADSP